MSSLQVQVHATNVTTACMGMSHSFYTAMYILEGLLKDLQQLEQIESLGNRSFVTLRLQSWAELDCGRGTVRCVTAV